MAKKKATKTKAQLRAEARLSQIQKDKKAKQAAIKAAQKKQSRSHEENRKAKLEAVKTATEKLEERKRLMAQRKDARLQKEAVKRERDAQVSEVMRAKIREWLDGERDFNEGVELMAQVSNNLSIIHMFNRRGAATIDTLVYHLEKIASFSIIRLSLYGLRKYDEIMEEVPTGDDSGNGNGIDINTEEGRRNLIESLGTGFDSKDLAVEVKEYYDRACEYHKVHTSLHEKQKALTTDEDRKAGIAAIRKVEEDKQSCWDVINKWINDGEKPVAPEPIEVNAGNKDLTVTKCKSYLTKALIGNKNNKPIIEKRKDSSNEAYEAYKKDCKLRVDFLLKETGTLGRYEESAKAHGLVDEQDTME